MGTLGECLASASRYWASRESTRCRGTESMMIVRARLGVSILGASLRVSSLRPGVHGPKLLEGLADGGRAASTIGHCYRAFLRMLAIAGKPQELTAWPQPPHCPRKAPKPGLSGEDVDKVVRWMRGVKDWQDTADLVDLLWRTGLRSHVEAIRPGALEIEGEGVLKVVAGKGGHQRRVPVREHSVDETLLTGIGGLTYEGHLRRLKVAQRELGIGSWGFHDLRRGYAKRAYEATGKDLRATQLLLGHSKPETTAGYIGIPAEEMRSVAF